jgi:hypothetical protein
LERRGVVARSPVGPYSRTVGLECARVLVVFVWWRDSFGDMQQCFSARIYVSAEEYRKGSKRYLGVRKAPLNKQRPSAEAPAHPCPSRASQLAPKVNMRYDVAACAAPALKLRPGRRFV